MIREYNISKSNRGKVKNKTTYYFLVQVLMSTKRLPNIEEEEEEEEKKKKKQKKKVFARSIRLSMKSATYSY